MNREYTFALVGSEGVGKTCMLTRFTTGEFIKEHVHTATNTACIRVNTTIGNIILNVVELRVPTLPVCDGVIVMFDLTDTNTFYSSIGMVDHIRANYPNLPIVWVGNKTDVRGRKVKPALIDTYNKLSVPYFDCSSRSNYQLERPFRTLLRKVCNNHSLLFIVNEPIAPPEVQIDADLLARIEAEMASALTGLAG